MRPGGSDRDDAAGLLGTPFRRARFRAAVHYVCWVCEDPRALGTRRLGLVLWYAERNLHLRRGAPLSGATYVRHHAGPRPRALEAQLRELERDGLLARRPGGGGGGDGPDLLFALAPPDLGRLGAEEVAELEAATRGVCLDARATVPRRAAHDAVWRAALIGETLPHFTACAGQGAELLPADVRWAAREAEAGPAPGGGARVAGLGRHARGREAAEALLWHLRRDPALGLSLPAGEGSWFAYRQAGVAEAGVPEAAAVYRLELDELLPAAVRVEPAPDEDGLGDETGDEPDDEG